MFERIKLIGDQDWTPIPFRYLKLVEEVGEAAASVLLQEKSPNVSASTSSTVLEELSDVLICALDILFQYGYTQEEIESMVLKKLDKWMAKIHKNQSA
jgi:NTP pyrophosphatase (non-canonical NTP hydrolase)